MSCGCEDLKVESPGPWMWLKSLKYQVAGFRLAKRSDSVETRLETMKCTKSRDRCYLHLQLFLPRVHCPFTEGDLLRDECKAFDFLASVARRQGLFQSRCKKCTQTETWASAIKHLYHLIGDRLKSLCRATAAPGPRRLSAL